jgi:dihydroorotate dehydrogenase electron transfer subunit
MSNKFTVVIDKIVEETPRVKSFYFKYPLLAEPGQYLKVTVPGFGDRPFGAVITGGNTFLISVAAVGEATKHLHTMKPGDTLEMEGPIGTFFTFPDKIEGIEPKLALVAGGYGLAPLGFLANCAAALDYDVTLFAGARTKEDFICYPFLETPKIKIVRTTDDGSEGEKGFITDTFRKAIEKEDFTNAYIVGPLPMEELVIEICEENGIPYQVSMEQFAYEAFGPVVDATILDGNR